MIYFINGVVLATEKSFLFAQWYYGSVICEAGGNHGMLSHDDAPVEDISDW